MTISSTLIVLLSALCMFSVTGQDLCLEVFSVSDLIANKINLDFVAQDFNGLGQDAINVQKMAQAINIACIDVSVALPQTDEEIHKSCASILPILSSLSNNYAYGQSGNSDGQAKIVSIFEQVLSLSVDISYGDCLNVWAMQAIPSSEAAGDEVEQQVETSVETEVEADQTSFGSWHDRLSYLNTNIEVLVADIELVIQYSNTSNDVSGSSNSTNVEPEL